MASSFGNESKATAGAAGVSGGTLMAVIATTLPEGNKLKPLLIWAAPSVSILIGGLWLRLQLKFANHLRDRELEQRIRKTKELLEEELNEPDITPERRAEIEKQIKELRDINISRQMERIKSLKIISEEDIESRTRL